MHHERLLQELLGRAGQALLAQTSDAVLILDPQGVILGGSSACSTLLAQPLAALTGQVCFSLLQIDPVAHSAISEHVCHVGQPPQAVVVHFTPLTDAEGRCVGMVALFTSAPTVHQDLVAQLQRREERLYANTTRIGEALDLREVLAHVVQGAIELTDAAAGAFPLFDREHELIVPGYMINLNDPLRFAPHTRGTGTIWQIIDSGTTKIFNQYPQEPAALKELIEQGVMATMGVPVYAGNHIIGVIVLYHCTPQRFFSRQDAEIVEILARQTGAAIQNARLYQAAISESDRRHTLYQASVALGAALDLEELYMAVHQSVQSLMRCDTCIIGLADEGLTSISQAYRHDGKRRWVGTTMPIQQSLLGYVARYELSLRISDDTDARTVLGERFAPEPGEPHQALVATAMRVGEQIIGAIVIQAREPYAYSSADLSTLEMLTATAAIAIRNAQLFAQVQRLATTDPLTGIANRRHFYDLAHRELERSERYGMPIGVVLFDVDHFKRINDTHGHFIGDQVLRAIALRCSDDLREIDTLARFGGEEFIVLLPETGYMQARYVAERLRQRIAQSPIETDAGPIPVTISAGVASSESFANLTFDVLFSHADTMLYTAKHAGRNQVR
jgi:diguanylate cyclase (GGDEF)-like protein